jgi:hypothetical protein
MYERLLNSTMASEQHKREEEIERLARETGRLIRGADPETQEELREAAAAMMREEAHQTQETTHPERRQAMNPMAGGIGLLVIGAGLAFIMPPMGVVLIVLGFVALVWGALISGFKK